MMGAFDGELSRLGYRFYAPQEQQPKPTAEQRVLEQFKAAMHVARMPCPGSCGQRCANHFCSAHNGEAFMPKTAPKPGEE